MKTALAIIVALIVIAGGYFLLAKKTQAPVDTMGTTQPTTTDTATPNAPNQPQTVTVRYTDTGFSPQSITVPAGTKVTFVNNSSQRMWVGSDVHPVHAEYDGTTLAQHCGSGTSFDQCKAEDAGTSYSFTFTKAGTFGYHNHTRANDRGTVIVQ